MFSQIKNQIKKLYHDSMFCPSWLGIFLNPFYLARKNLCSAMTDLSAELTGSLLDVGCGTKPYKDIFKVSAYVGLDIDSSVTRKLGIADALYDGKRFPYKEATFDSVLCNQVLEHVFNPDEFLQEIHRVLKDGGKLVLTVPFVWDEHEQPYDYARYSSFGLCALLKKNGFVVVRHKKLGADATILFQLANAYIYKASQSWPFVLKILITMTVMPFINITGVFAGRVLPGNPDLFLDQVVLAEKRK